jgi:hypothetical protein
LKTYEYVFASSAQTLHKCKAAGKALAKLSQPAALHLCKVFAKIFAKFEKAAVVIN